MNKIKMHLNIIFTVYLYIVFMHDIHNTHDICVHFLGF